MSESGEYGRGATSERMTLFFIRRDYPVPACEFPERWINSLLKKGYIKRHEGLPTFVEITEKGEEYFAETM